MQFVACAIQCARVAFLMPTVSASVSGQKPEIEGFEGDTLGAHLRRRRRERDLYRKDAAGEMGVSEEALMKWERDSCEPPDRLYPKVIAFLGREPWAEPETLGERLRAERRRRGLSIKRAAAMLNIDEGAFTQWERGLRMPTRSSRVKIDSFLAPKRTTEVGSSRELEPVLGTSLTR